MGIIILAAIITIIIVLLKKQKQDEAEASQQAARQAEQQRVADSRAKAEAERQVAAARRAEWERTHGRIVTAIAGVTFNNEDGSSRQKILRDLKATGAYGNISLEETEYKGAPAVSVKVDDECIGMIPKTRVQEVLAVMDRLTSAALDIETFRPEEEEDEDGNVRRRGELIYRADLTLIYNKEPTEA